ncbi:MAG TPA: hypothetical protein VHO07_17250, partial [Streptosporangiaceae bacterium]|nr:hypothetical protein [Streptosporangiaceae bacterium]
PAPSRCPTPPPSTTATIRMSRTLPSAHTGDLHPPAPAPAPRMIVDSYYRHNEVPVHDDPTNPVRHRQKVHSALA